MAAKELTDDELRAALEAFDKYGNETEAADSLSLKRQTYQYHLYKARARQEELHKKEKIAFPDDVLSDEDEPIDEILSRLRKAQERKQRAAEARNWFPIKIKEDKPYGVLWFGDPHLGPSTNWDLLERHIAVARQDGVYGGNIGDSTDNWPWTGRLARLWAETDISHKTERRLATWFMMEAGISWLVWLLGNHDAFNSGTEFYKMLGAHQVPVIDWRAQFTLVHKNGSQTRIDAAHGRKGTYL